MHHNIIADNGGSELSGYSTFTAYIYDASNTASRILTKYVDTGAAPVCPTVVRPQVELSLSFSRSVSTTR